MTNNLDIGKLRLDWKLEIGNWKLGACHTNTARLITFLIMSVLALGLLLTYTRIAWISALLFFVLIGLKYYRKILIYSVVATALFYAVFYPVNSILIDNFNVNLQSINVISRLTARNEESDSISWRQDVTLKVIPLMLDRPLLGYGYGSFAKVWDDYKGVANLWDATSEAHNDYLKVGFESGAVGLLLFLSIFTVILFKQIRYGLKNNFNNLVFIGSILVYLVLSLSDNMLHHTPVAWWMWTVWGVWGAMYDTTNSMRIYE